MNNTKSLKRTFIAAFLVFCLTACVILNESIDSSIVSTQAKEVPAITASPLATLPPSATPARTQIALDDLEPIRQENAHQIAQVAELAAQFPAYYQISPDGRVGARANLTAIDILDMTSGELLMRIPVDLPDCEFGGDRYWVFNQNGSFIALAARDKIQVWQVGGGMIYEAPYDQRYSTDEGTCGADVPQLALSPDGLLLAISGVEYTRASARQYFRIIAVLQNQTVYEWSGQEDEPHGKLYPYQGLGFSGDGKVIQTFDQTRYFVSSGTEYESFRFWSVGDWVEIAPDSQLVLESFNGADLLYALQEASVLHIKQRLNGEVLASLKETGCGQIESCDVRFSPEGRCAALLHVSNSSLSFHQDLLASRVSIWELSSQSMLNQASTLARNLDGMFIADNGQLQDVFIQGESDSSAVSWWTSSYHFNGLLESSPGFISFSPQRLGMDDPDCYFCGSCSLDFTDLSLDCRKGELNLDEFAITFNREAGSLTIHPAGMSKVDVDVPIDLTETTDVRLLGFAPENETTFYCLDKDQRSQSCYIYAAESDKTVATPEDIYSLRFAPDGSSAAYIDRAQKALFIVNFSKSKAAKVSAYQSRAWFANPVFLAQGSELVYLIQNLEDETILSLEWVNAQDGKVLRRAALDMHEIGQPSVLAVNQSAELIAIGDQDGWIYLLDEEKGKLISSWRAHAHKLIGLTFAGNDHLLVSLAESGEFKLWGVQ